MLQRRCSCQGLMVQVADIEKAEKDKMKGKVEKIIGHGINCFINRQLIYNYPEELFADAGVMAIEHADFDGIERLGLVTGETSVLFCRALHDCQNAFWLQLWLFERKYQNSTRERAF